MNRVINQDFVLRQMQENSEQKKLSEKIERQYYKPHFGPEETNELVRQHIERAKDI